MMKKIFFIFVLLIPFCGFSQAWENIFNVPKYTTTFGTYLPVNTKVYAVDSNKFYRINAVGGTVGKLSTVSNTVVIGVTGATGATGSTGPTGSTGATGSNSGITTLRTTANQTINAGAATFTDITNLTFSVTNGTSYSFIAYVVYQSANVLTGWKAGINCPNGNLHFYSNGNSTIGNTTALASTFAGHRTGNTRDDMSILLATVTANVDLCLTFEGRYECTQDGTFALRFANETAANTDITVRSGSWLIYW